LSEFNRGVSLFKGRVYKISCTEPDVSQVYIGQTIGTLKTRWNSHKRKAGEFPNNFNSKKFDQKAAKLYRAMNLFHSSQLEIEELESHEYEDKNELRNKLNERENYFIEQFDSIKKGWNKIYASKIELPLEQDIEETWSSIANKFSVDVRKLMHQVNKNELSIEEAVKTIREREKKPTRQYSYGMQTYAFIKELLPYDKNKIGKKNIERRIRDFIKNNKLKIILHKDKNIQTIYLIDDIFNLISLREKTIKVITPDANQEEGTITDLHQKLLSLYPDYVPDAYVTIQNRLNKKHPKKTWTPEQAFGFRFPPGLEEVENRIKNEDYQWGEINGVIKIPSFKKEPNRTAKPNPIILHPIKRVYLTEKDWCDAYKLSDRKTIKKLRDEGKTNEEILEYYGKKP
tara:strand:+ start:50 stop:1249 length:1200 start_codon:yes stop_codon:yes gene_type:complete